MDSQSFINQANKYKHAGFNPVCIHKPSKYPKGYNWQQYQKKQVTQQDIIDMSTVYKTEELNIGIITGKISNLIVLDIDSEAGMHALSSHNISLPDTLCATTGRGKHYYFQYIDNPILKTDSGLLTNVDLRTDGGLVVAPTSVHPNGSVYTFINPNASVLPFPTELLDLFTELHKAKATVAKSATKGVSLEQRATEGTRNATLFKAACALQGIGFSEDVIRQAISNQNELLSDPLDEVELERTVLSSVFKYNISAEIRGLSDYDNALRMKDLFSKNNVYVPELKEWLKWDGKIWSVDTELSVLREKFIAMSYTIPKEVPRPNEEDEAEMKAYATREAFAKGCKDNRRFVSALPFMQGIMYKSATEFDTHNDLLCVTNGVLNLKTMKLLPHDPKYMMRTMSTVHYDVGAKSLKWDAFLDDVFGNDEELRGYVQRAVGYTLSGNNLEKAFFILKGESNSGKSVFLNVIGHILGGFYKKANIETFLQKSTMGGARPDLASMMNKRVVVASETNEGDRFDEKLIKDITGGEPLTCRDLYKGEVTYQPMFKIWLSTNVLPVVRDDSNGVWNRVKVVSFNNVVPSEKMDVHLTDKLRADATGILNWCLAGYQMYLEDGLVEPVTLTDQVASYREENDLFGSFITDCFILNKPSKIERMAAFDIFNDWCLKTKSYQRGMSNRKFYKKMRDKGFNESRAVDTRYFDGLAVKVGNSAVKQVEGNKMFVEF